MMAVQLSFVAILSGISALILEPGQGLYSHMSKYWLWIIFLALVDGLGFVLMATGQNFSPPTHAAIILSLEGVFASVAR